MSQLALPNVHGAVAMACERDNHPDVSVLC